MSADTRITAQHVSLYLTLFDCWNDNRFRNPFVPVQFRDNVPVPHRISQHIHQVFKKDLTE